MPIQTYKKPPANAVDLKVVGDYWSKLGDELFAKDDNSAFTERNHKQAHKKALIWYKKAVEIDPYFISAWQKLGWTYYMLRRYNDFWKVSQKCCSLQPKNHHNWYQLGTALKRKRKINEAINAYKKAVRLEPRNELALGALGRIYAEMGQMRRVSNIYNKLKYLDKAAAGYLKYLLQENSSSQLKQN